MRLRDFMPLFRMELELPLIEVRTGILWHNVMMRATEYLTWYIRIWKWRWQFTFWDDERRRRWGKVTDGRGNS